MRVKIERAKKHISDLDVEVNAFLDSRPYTLVTNSNDESPRFTAMLSSPWMSQSQPKEGCA
jgi:hypothetical protein